MHRAKGRMKARNDMIDFLLANNEGAMEIDGKFVPVYDLSDPQLLQLYDIVRDEYDSRISKQSQKRIISGCGYNGRGIQQTRRNESKIPQAG